MRTIAALFAGLLVTLALTGSSGAAGDNAKSPSWEDNQPVAKSANGIAGHAVDDNGSNLTTEQMNDAIAILHEFDPERAQRLEERLHDNPRLARAAIAPILPKLTSINYLKTHNPELYKLRLEDFKMNSSEQELAAAYHQAIQKNDTEKSTQLMTKLQAKVTEHFNLRQTMQEREVEMRETKIYDLRQQIEAGKTAQQQLIADHIAELTVPHTWKPVW